MFKKGTQLAKTFPSYTKNPNHRKYVVDTQSDIYVAKIGNSKELETEYNFSLGLGLAQLEGFVGYTSYCNTDEDPQTGVIIMPHFPLGSIAKYKWTEDNLSILKTSIKHAMLSVINAFQARGIIHGDLHIGNVLLESTKQTHITYNIDGIGEFTIPTHGIRTWIMDFENSFIANMSTSYNKIMTYNKFYYDLTKCIGYLQSVLKTIDGRSLVAANTLLYTRLLRSEMMTRQQVQDLLDAIDTISFLSPHI
jgi:hypothetical protein